GGGRQIDKPMHCGVLVGAAWETAVLVVVAALVTVGPDAGDEGCDDAHDAAATHPTAMTAINRIALDIDADLSGRLVCRGQVLGGFEQRSSRCCRSGRARHPSSRGPVSQRTRRDHRWYSGVRSVVTRIMGPGRQTIAGSRVSSHAWIRSATLTQPGSSIMSWLILGYISAS